MRKTWEVKTFQKGDKEMVEGLTHIEDGIANASGGTTVIANPTLAGAEPDLTGLQVGSNKYKVPVGSGSEPAAYLKSAAVSGNTLTLIKKMTQLWYLVQLEHSYTDMFLLLLMGMLFVHFK